MFVGEYHPNKDEKGRVAIPVKLRKAFSGDCLINRLVITHGFDKCIIAFREEDWDDFVKIRLVPLSQSDPRNRMIMRHFLGGANYCDLDKQGRMLVPQYLLEYADIKKDITILGLNDHIEIWSRDVYDSYKPDDETSNIFAGDLGF
ncbi:division/cell wall cluster transcriptional repressor MraZ [Spirochaetota bacterium]